MPQILTYQQNFWQHIEWGHKCFVYLGIIPFPHISIYTFDFLYYIVLTTGTEYTYKKKKITKNNQIEIAPHSQFKYACTDVLFGKNLILKCNVIERATF